MAAAAAMPPSDPDAPQPVKQNPVAVARGAMQGLRSDNAEQGAAVLSSLDLRIAGTSDAVAAEVSWQWLGQLGRGGGSGCAGPRAAVCRARRLDWG